MVAGECRSPDVVELLLVLPKPPAFWLLLWPKPEKPPNVDMLITGDQCEVRSRDASKAEDARRMEEIVWPRKRMGFRVAAR